MEDFTEKVILKKIIITPQGSYFPRQDPYDLADIPKRYRTSEYLTNSENSIVSVQKLNQLTDKNFPSAPGASDSRTIKPTYIKMAVSEQTPVETTKTQDTSISSLIEADTPALTAIAELLSVAEEASELLPLLDEQEQPSLELEQPVVTEEPQTTEQQEQPAKLNINTATLEEIEALPKVGAKTARKVVRLREELPFNSIEDLDTRAALAFGKSWELLADQIEVD